MWAPDAASIKARESERAKGPYQQPELGIVLRGAWTCDAHEVTRADLRRFLADGFRKLRSVADQERLEDEDHRRLLELAFTLFSKAEEVIWRDVQATRQEDEDRGSEGDLIELSDEDAQVLKEIAEEQEAATRRIMQLTWEEEPSAPEGEISAEFENYSL